MISEKEVSTDKCTIFLEKNIACWENVIPNFIHNRFDLSKEGICFLLKVIDGKEYYIPFKIERKKAVLGVWGVEISYHTIAYISNWIFKNHKSVNQIEIRRPIQDKMVNFSHLTVKNDVFIELPNDAESLDKRLSSKGRYNIKREKRIIQEEFGECVLCNVKATEGMAEELTNRFFQLKFEGYKSVYNMTAEEYLKKFCVTDIYYMKFGEDIGAILMSCEQCPIVYLENLTYDNRYSKFSPGQVAYDFYLKELIKKGKRGVFLLGGEYGYKKRYGSQERMVVEYTLVRKSIKSYIEVYGKKIIVKIFNLLPSTFKNFYLKH